jgi:hypothetical protein
MKKILSILLLSVFLFSCKKSEQTKTEQTKYKVNLTVSDFAATTAVMSVPGTKSTLAIGDTLKNYADNLYYRIYNSSGVWVNSVEQASTVSTFGTINDALPTGTYNVFIAASKGFLSLSSTSTPYTDAAYAPFTIWNDTFAKAFTLTVGTSAVNQAVRLDRVVAGLQVVLEDAIPTNAAKISVVVNPDCFGLYMKGTSSTTDDPRTTEFTLTTADKGVKNKSFMSYVGNTVATASVSIRAYTSTGTLIIEKTIPNLTFEKSKRTILTGSLFTGTSTQSAGFAITVNPSWTNTTPVKF